MSSYRSREDEVLAGVLANIREEEGNELSIDELPYLYRTVHLLAARWNVFSLQLGVTGQEQIQRSARATDICLALALVEWLQSGAASWRGLVEAIFRPSGGGHQVLARQITTSYRGLCQFRPDGCAVSVRPTPIAATDESVGLIQQLLENNVAARWFQMGVVMGVPLSDLEIIRESPDHHGAGEREGAMLRAWLQRGLLPRTWQVLVDAVEHRAGGSHRALAKKIASLPLESYGAPTATSSDQQPPSESAPPPRPAPARTLDSKPSLRDLTILKTHSGDKIEIIKSLAPDWKGFGVFLNFDDVGAHLALIEARHGQMNPLACCRDMLTHWVSGNGEQPTTWKTLVGLLVDCERATLAEQIRQALSS